MSSTGDAGRASVDEGKASRPKGAVGVRGRLTRSPRASAALSVACGLVAMIAVRAYASTVAGSRGAGAAGVPVVVATRPVARGAVVSPADLRLRSVPSAYAQPGSFSTISQAAG